jgi:hypothetical protein
MSVVRCAEVRTEADSYHASAVGSLKATLSVPRAVMKITAAVCTEQVSRILLSRACYKNVNKSAGLLFVRTKRTVGNVAEVQNKSAGYVRRTVGNVAEDQNKSAGYVRRTVGNVAEDQNKSAGRTLLLTGTYIRSQKVTVMFPYNGPHLTSIKSVISDVKCTTLPLGDMDTSFPPFILVSL